MSAKRSFRNGAWAPNKHNDWVKTRNRINALLNARAGEGK